MVAMVDNHKKDSIINGLSWLPCVYHAKSMVAIFEGMVDNYGQIVNEM